MSNKRHRPDSPWTEEVIETLTNLWREKKSASAIAVRLKEKFGAEVSRNSVIGKLYRLGLIGQGQPANTPRRAPKKARAGKTPPPPSPAPPPVTEDAITQFLETREEPILLAASERVTLLDLRPGVCRFPIGDPLSEEFTFCGAKCSAARSYCEEHHALSYVPIQKVKKVAWRAFR